MYIQVEETPNPDTLKFIPGVPVMPMGSAYFEKAAEAAKSKLALSLFDLKGVESVFLGSDFITVKKTTDSHWDYLKPQSLSVIMEHFVSGTAVIDEAPKPADDSDDDDPIIVQIKELLDQNIRPAVAQDGGDIVFDRFEDGIVYLHMQGACAGCPSSTATLKVGIENMMKHYIPEVVEVRAAA